MSSSSAFSSYDWSTPAWRDYERNLLVPPGADADRLILKYKRRWYQRNVDPDFPADDTAAINDNAQHSQPQPQPQPQPQAQSDAPLPPPPPPYVPPSTSRSVMLSYAQLVLHVGVLVSSPLILLPFVPTPYNAIGYTAVLLLAAAALTLAIVRVRGFPFIGGNAVGEYFAALIRDDNAHFLFLAAIMLVSPVNPIIAAPFVSRSLLFTAGAATKLVPIYAPTLWPRIQSACIFIVDSAADISRTNALLEIVAAATAALQILFGANGSIITAFVLAQYLRIRYQVSADTANAFAVIKGAVDRQLSASWVPNIVRVVWSKVCAFAFSLTAQSAPQSAATASSSSSSSCAIM